MDLRRKLTAASLQSDEAFKKRGQINDGPRDPNNSYYSGSSTSNRGSSSGIRGGRKGTGSGFLVIR